MSEKWEPPNAATLEAIRATANRLLTPDEVRAQLRIPVTTEEESEVRSLIAWFRRRYPTPAERLAYVRRAYRRWTGARSSPRR